MSLLANSLIRLFCKSSVKIQTENIQKSDKYIIMFTITELTKWIGGTQSQQPSTKVSGLLD